MDNITIIILVLILLAICGFVVFLLVDYFKFKDSVKTDIITADNAIATETNNRLSNLKYVVNQVNTVNSDIASTFTSNVNSTNSRVGSLETTQSSLLGSMNKSFSYSSNIGSTSRDFNFLNLPSSSMPNMNLLNHVTMVSGLTINDLNSASDPNHQMKLCFDANNCIKLPNENGDTYFTAQLNKSIEMGSPVRFTKDASFANSFNNVGGRIYGMATGTAAGTDAPALRINSNKVGMGASEVVPVAGLHLTQSDPTAPIMQVDMKTPNGQQPLLIDNTGKVIAANAELGNAKSKLLSIVDGSGNTVGQISAGTTGELVIQATSGITVNGSLKVKGAVSSSTGTIGTSAA
jgi:hypothetical protein